MISYLSELPDTTINVSWQLMTTRLFDCPLVIQHSHEEWPELDDLLINDVDFFSYVALPERAIKKLMASLHPHSFCSGDAVATWVADTQRGCHSGGYSHHWILHGKWHIVFFGQSPIYRHEFPLETFVYRQLLSLPCLITEERTFLNSSALLFRKRET